MNKTFPPNPIAYYSGHPDVELTIPKGQVVAGHAVGILVLDLGYPLLPGNVANASTYPFPVRFKVLAGTSIPQIMRHDRSLLDAIMEGGNELIRDGARAIVGACGYFGYYQKEAARALDAQVYLSSLLQIPMIRQSLKPDQKVGVICANLQAMSKETLVACNVNDPSELVIGGAEKLPSFKNIFECTCRLNPHQMEEELVGLAVAMVKKHPEIGALLLECSDMPPFSCNVQTATGLPVYDFITLIRWVHSGLVQQPYRGFF